MDGTDTPGGTPRSRHALDALNFFMADVQTGVGPYLAIFLKTARHYDPQQVGIAVAAGSVAQVLLQAPAGAFIDRTRATRVLVAVAAGLTALGATGIVLFRPLWTTVVAQVLIGGAGAVFPPAVAALSLGIVGRAALPRRQSRNEAFNHGGNLVAAAAFGAVGYFVAQAGIFWCVVALGGAAAAAVLAVRESDIDHERFLVAFAARGLLFAFVRNDVALLGVQVLDGVGAGIFGVLNVLVIAELTKGTGRFNLAQGATATAIGIGAAASNAGAGVIAKHAGYHAGFLTLAAVGAAGFALYAWGMPETAPRGDAT